jgi:RNA polymerase sigma-70 factor (ECF subfamily)
MKTSDELSAQIETDEQLVVSARAGNERAFDELVSRHARRTYGMVARILGDRASAEDVVQETFVRAWRGLASFRGDAQFSTWLYRIAVNEANRYLARETRRELFSYEDVMMKVPDISADVPLRAESSETRRLLERLLSELPANYRAPVVLRDVEGSSNEEAADLLGLDLRNFKSRLHRGRMALRKALEDLASDS